MWKADEQCSKSGQQSFSTTPLHNHAKIFHCKLYEEEKNYKMECSSAAQGCSKCSSLVLKKKCEMQKQMSVEDSFTSKKIWDINDEKSKQIHRKFAIMIALDNQPFSITEDDGFIGLMAFLQSRYLIPSRNYFSETAIPILYDQIKKKVFNEVAKSQYISFTSDIWTCPTSHETFISLSGHWIKKKFEHKDAVLYASHFPEAHTGINIAGKFINMLESWEINARRKHILVKDGAANMSLGSKLI
ncbi:zinc finger BED domain-containing protein 4-like [Hydra vulgaris]|uniref:zinc finger BED domain-containing protein 4-like n=1 Tax=Hydra vulgaris TaxID=6087 RepID=UPI001F5F8D80|nr:zinc finger BED domain-containing protein 4-like [Hydra vulgaris]